MNGSITDVFLRCMSDAKKSIMQKGRAYRCPFHDSHTYKFYLYEDKSGYRCYSGKCPNPSGGIIQLVISFDYAENASDASRWLSDRGLIDPTESHGIEYRSSVINRHYVKPEGLNPMQRSTWWYGQIHLIQSIGKFEASKLHANNAIRHYILHQSRERYNKILLGDIQEWSYEEWRSIRNKSLREEIKRILEKIYALDLDEKITEDSVFCIIRMYQVYKALKCVMEDL